MRGLDPRSHLAKKMDCRVKRAFTPSVAGLSGNDALKAAQR